MSVTNRDRGNSVDPGEHHSYLNVQYDDGVCTITLTRPRHRNALSLALVGDLTRAFEAVESNAETRVVVLAAAGPAFCAGGDIREYAATGHPGASAEALTGLLATIAACPTPVVARVHGAAYGGGVGLICATDIAIASSDARFSLSEARLGLVPAAIAPYVLQALGTRRATAYMLEAASFGVSEALASGLIHRAVDDDQLDSAVGEVVNNVLRCPPGALRTIKRLSGLLAASDSAVVDVHVSRVTSDEGREGLAAFLEKRPAAWVPPRLRQS